jgi:RHS repeat-associated protein
MRLPSFWGKRVLSLRARDRLYRTEGSLSSDYDAYGACTVLDPDGSADADGLSDVENPYTFTGRRLDDESGLMQYRNRYYSVELGRFMSRDPLPQATGAIALRRCPSDRLAEEAGSRAVTGRGPANLYWYCHGSPASHVDPSGLASRDVGCTAQAIVREIAVRAKAEACRIVCEAAHAGVAPVLPAILIAEIALAPHFALTHIAVAVLAHIGLELIQNLVVLPACFRACDADLHMNLAYVEFGRCTCDARRRYAGALEDAVEAYRLGTVPGTPPSAIGQALGRDIQRCVAEFRKATGSR